MFPQTVLLDFHNASSKGSVVDLVFDRAHFPGEIALTLPKKIEFSDKNRAVSDFTEVPRDAFKEFLHEEVGRWFERVGEFIERVGEKLSGDASDDLPRSRRSERLASLDRSRIYQANTGLLTPTIRGAVLSSGGKFTVGITILAPSSSKPGDSYRLDVIQRDGAAIKGGSTYVIAIA